MAVIKCKMCGGELNITEGESVAECARAYIGKLCVEREKPSLADIAEKDSYADELEASGNFRRALRFADSALRAELEQCLESVKQNQKLRREEEDRLPPGDHCPPEAAAGTCREGSTVHCGWLLAYGRPEIRRYSSGRGQSR